MAILKAGSQRYGGNGKASAVGAVAEIADRAMAYADDCRRRCPVRITPDVSQEETYSVSQTL